VDNQVGGQTVIGGTRYVGGAHWQTRERTTKPEEEATRNQSGIRKIVSETPGVGRNVLNSSDYF
jgi:hypothetical protein